MPADRARTGAALAKDNATARQRDVRFIAPLSRVKKVNRVQAAIVPVLRHPFQSPSAQQNGNHPREYSRAYGLRTNPPIVPSSNRFSSPHAAAKATEVVGVMERASLIN